MYKAICAMFKGPKSRVILTNEHHTDYFYCTIGVKQGDSISPTLFACFLNDLSQEIKATNLGIQLNCGDENNDDDRFTVNNLLYADDIVLLAESEIELQTMLNVVFSLHWSPYSSSLNPGHK